MKRIGFTSQEDDVPEEGPSKKKKDFSEHVVKLFAFLLDRYQPASREDASIRKTTSEIYDELQEHCPSKEYDKESVYQFLLDSNFKFETPGGDMHFVWLMKYKQVSSL